MSLNVEGILADFVLKKFEMPRSDDSGDGDSRRKSRHRKHKSKKSRKSHRSRSPSSERDSSKSHKEKNRDSSSSKEREIKRLKKIKKQDPLPLSVAAQSLQVSDDNVVGESELYGPSLQFLTTGVENKETEGGKDLEAQGTMERRNSDYGLKNNSFDAYDKGNGLTTGAESKMDADDALETNSIDGVEYDEPNANEVNNAPTSDSAAFKNAGDKNRDSKSGSRSRSSSSRKSDASRSRSRSQSKVKSKKSKSRSRSKSVTKSKHRSSSRSRSRSRSRSKRSTRRKKRSRSRKRSKSKGRSRSRSPRKRSRSRSRRRRSRSRRLSRSRSRRRTRSRSRRRSLSRRRRSLSRERRRRRSLSRRRRSLSRAARRRARRRRTRRSRSRSRRRSRSRSRKRRRRSRSRSKSRKRSRSKSRTRKRSRSKSRKRSRSKKRSRSRSRKRSRSPSISKNRSPVRRLSRSVSKKRSLSRNKSRSRSRLRSRSKSRSRNRSTSRLRRRRSSSRRRSRSRSRRKSPSRKRKHSRSRSRKRSRSKRKKHSRSRSRKRSSSHSKKHSRSRSRKRSHSKGRKHSRSKSRSRSSRRSRSKSFDKDSSPIRASEMNSTEGQDPQNETANDQETSTANGTGENESESSEQDDQDKDKSDACDENTNTLINQPEQEAIVSQPDSILVEPPKTEEALVLQDMGTPESQGGSSSESEDSEASCEPTIYEADAETTQNEPTDVNPASELQDNIISADIGSNNPNSETLDEEQNLELATKETTSSDCEVPIEPGNKETTSSDCEIPIELANKETTSSDCEVPIEPKKTEPESKPDDSSHDSKKKKSSSSSKKKRSRSRSVKKDKKSKSSSKSKKKRSSSKSRSKRSKRSRSRSRSRSKSKERRSRTKKSKFDQAKILQIAQQNVLSMIENGTMPEGLSLEQFKKDQLANIKSGGKSVQELTDFCTELSKRENEPATEKKEGKSTKKDGDSGAGDAGFIHHPFKIKEPSTIRLNIRNAIPIPIKTPAEKLAETAKLSSQFPVSSGKQHQQKELEWIPVEPKTSTTTKTTDSKAVVAAAAGAAEGKKTDTAGAAAPLPVPPPPPPPAKDPVPELKPPPLPPLLPPLPPPPSLSNLLSKPEATATVQATGYDMSYYATAGYPAGYTAYPTPKTPVSYPDMTAASSSQSAGYQEQSVFKKPSKPIDVAAVVTKRFKALTQLQANPNDYVAMNELHEAQSSIQNWVESQQVPGLFTGTTDAKILSVAELSGPRHLNPKLQKDMFLRAAPVTGGRGMSLLKKMGWNPGEGLGKNKEGSLEPLVLDIKYDKKGLVSEGEGGKKTLATVTKELQGKHPVSALMELCSKRKWKPPLYTMIKDAGPSHKKSFLFKVEVNGVEYIPVSPCLNKKIAKADAAVVCLQALNVFGK